MSAPRNGRLLRSSPWARTGAAVVLTALATLAALACLFDVASLRVADAVAGRMDGAATVVVWGHGLESSDAAAARAEAIIAALPGVTGARALDPAPGDTLVARLAGAPETPSPRLVTVHAPGGGAIAADITQALRAAALPARVAGPPPLRGGRWRMVAGILVPLCALTAFALACMLAAGREATRAAGTLELLRMAGASDGYAAGLIRDRVAGLAFMCVLWGGAAALVIAALSSRARLPDPLAALVRADLLSPWPVVLLVLWLAGVAAAWFAARARLGKAAP